MKTIKDIINEELQFNEAISQELQAKLDADDDVSCVQALKCVLNNWYGYAKNHNEGTNVRKFKAADVTSFRNCVKDIANGEFMGGLKPHNEKVINMAKELYTTMKSIKSDDFAGTMSALEGFAPRIKKLDKEMIAARNQAAFAEQDLIK